MDSRLEFQSVVLAALLHDIGKLLQRGSFGGLDIKGKHPAVSANFVTAFAECFSQVSDTSILKTLVQKHHESQRFGDDLNVKSISDEYLKTLATIVSLSDNLSSSERGEHTKEYQDYKDTPLASVLERVNTSEVTAPVFRFHSSPLTTPEKLRAIFPENIKVYNNGELTQLIETFGKDFSNLFKSEKSVVDRSNFECVVSHLYSILAKYTWCLPSDTQEVFPDVSLFDHLRTTSAIASCLYIYHSSNSSLKEKAVRNSDTKRFLLIAGDISGIQNYIFNIATTGVGGVARRLRARSLYVQLCSEVASHLVLRKLGLPITIHTLMNSGGHFYLLLPNISEAIGSIQESQKEIDNWFLKELNGELALNLAAVPFGDDGFKTEKGMSAGFGSVIKVVNEQLDRKKKNRFASVLQDNKKWQETCFEIPLVYQGEESCQSCHKFPKDKGELCSHCSLDRDIGRDLPGARSLAFYGDSNTGDIKILNCSASINPAKNPVPYLITRINDPDLSDLAAFPATFKYIARAIPARDDCLICQGDESAVATFACIAGRAKGDNLLGFLKMDVDNLGETIIFGLKPNDSISRVTTFSRMFDLFFAGWVEHLVEKNRDIYTIFSGGDDLLLVGPWDSILETAECLRDDFRKYTNNSTLTISAGVVINGHNYPIAAAAEDVQAALDVSKATVGKDCITVLDHTLKWEEWHRIAGEWLRLKNIVSNEKVPSTFLHNLLVFAEMWRQYRKGGNILGLRYHPLLSYAARRNINPRSAPELTKWTDSLLSIRPGNSEQPFLLDNLGLMAQLLILSHRGVKFMNYNKPPSQPVSPPRPPFIGQPSLPEGYLKDGYFDGDGNILKDVIMRWPLQLAKVFHESKPQLKTAQLRRFFQEVRRQEGRLTCGVSFAALKPQIIQLDSHAANALKKNNAPMLFRNFIGQNIKLAARDEKSFRAFVTHFECIVGYYPDTK